MQQATVINPFDAEFKAHAFPAYARLRSAEPVYRLTSLPDGAPIWLVLGYEEGQSVLKDYHRFANDPRAAMTAEQATALLAEATAGLSGEEQQAAVARDQRVAPPPRPQRSTRPTIRGCASWSPQSFTPRFVEGLRPRVQQIADDLLDAIERQAGATGGRETDLIAAFAFPLPITVISEMLGVPTADQDKFRVWSNAFVRCSPAARPTPLHREHARLRQLPAAALRRQAPPPRRRPGQRAGPGRVRRRRPDRERSPLDGLPADHRRPRDDGQPDRQRPARPLRAPGAVGAAEA